MESLAESPLADMPYHDVTLRDGGQAPGVVWRPQERVRIAPAPNDLGVEEIEGGMLTVPDVQEATKTLLAMNLRAKIVPFARARQDDIDETLDAAASAAVVEHRLNPHLNNCARGLTQDSLVDRLSKWISHAKDQGVWTTFLDWDVIRASFDHVLSIYKQVPQFAHPDALVITDSFGVATPHAAQAAVRHFRAAFPDTPLELHIHNEFGLAMGPVTGAVGAGVDGIHASVNGLGDSTGNIPTEEIAAALEPLDDSAGASR
jgi:methanogen homocitrate synthase